MQVDRKRQLIVASEECALAETCLAVWREQSQ
jgi:hypothetical protein